MKGNLERYRRIDCETRPQLGAITRAFDRIDMSGFEAAVRQMQGRQAEIDRALSLADMSIPGVDMSIPGVDMSIPGVDMSIPGVDLLNAARRLHELTLHVIPKADVFDRIHQSWIPNLDGVTNSAVLLERTAKLALSDISYRLAVQEPLPLKIDFGNLFEHLNIRHSLMYEVQHSMSRLTADYYRLAESFRNLSEVVEVPSFVLPGATNELYTSGYALHVLQPPKDEVEREVAHPGRDIVPRGAQTSDLIALLEREGSEFVSTYEGAIEALNGDNPDRPRHVLTSLRTLWEHLLRKCAPDQEVKRWVIERGEEAYLHDGNPTRRVKVSYMLRKVSNGPLVDFAQADADAMVRLYDLYNRLHSLETGLTDQQLQAITLKTESYLTYILELRKW